MSARKAVHACSTRHLVNAGMEIPACVAGARLLNTDSGRWPMAMAWSEVTCKRCLKLRSVQDGAK